MTHAYPAGTSKILLSHSSLKRGVGKKIYVLINSTGNSNLSCLEEGKLSVSFSVHCEG